MGYHNLRHYYALTKIVALLFNKTVTLNIIFLLETANYIPTVHFAGVK
jgi:hypothetical protein